MSDTHKTESLHDQIMRLPRDPAEYTNVNMMLAYKDGHRDARHAAAELAAAYEADAQQAAPAGWKLVPVEPTNAMWTAVNKLDDEMVAGGYDGKGCSIEQAWSCMLAAAPTPPAGPWESPCTPPAQQPHEWPAITKPAKIGSVRFEAGVSSRTVIEAAQRQYEYDVTPENEAERIARFDRIRAAVLAPPAQQPGALPEEVRGVLERARAVIEWMACRADVCQKDQRKLEESSAELRALLSATLAPPAPEQAEQPVKWGYAGTAGNLIAQLRTIDPGMPVYASLRVKNGVRDGVMLQGLIISYEHGDGRFIVKDGPEKCVVIWTQPDDRQAEQPRPVNRSVIRDVFLRNGFTIKEGHSDLKPYVYAAAEELLALDGKEVAAEQDAVTVPRELLECYLNGGGDWVEAGHKLRDLLGGGE